VKKLVCAVALCATVLAFGDDGAVGDKGGQLEVKDAERVRNENPVVENRAEAEIEKRRAACTDARNEADAREAAKQGISVEDLYLQRRAKELGVTVEAFKKMSPEERSARTRAKMKEGVAASLGLTVEQFDKLTPNERRAKLTEMQRKRVAERDAKNKANAGEDKPAEAPKTE